LCDIAAGLSVEPVLSEFGLAIQYERSADACDNLSDDNEAETLIHKHSETGADETEYATERDSDAGAVGIDNVGCGEGEYGMHEYEQKTA
jgi:hypothetical protein